jgi:hypothetical protein
MIINFLKKNKKLIVLCLVIFGIYLVSLFFAYNARLFCSTTNSLDSYECFNNIKSGFSGPTISFFPYIFFSLLILFFVSDRLKRNAVITILTISVPIFIFIFILVPIECSSLICSRTDISYLLRPLYPITTILTLTISAIYFYFKDKKQNKTRLR